MKKILTLLILLLLGIGIGGGAAYGVGMVMGPPPVEDTHAKEAKAEHVETAFIPTGALTLPIVTNEGDLTGYGVFELQLEVTEEGEAEVASQMPLVLNAINMRTYRTPMTAGKQKVLPDLDVLSRIAMEASTQSLGKGKVIRAVVTSAKPFG
jgi:hypothetical protein